GLDSREGTFRSVRERSFLCLRYVPGAAVAAPTRWDAADGGGGPGCSVRRPTARHSQDLLRLGPSPISSQLLHYLRCYKRYTCAVLKQLLVNAADFVRRQDEDDLVDSLRGAEELTGGLEGDTRGSRNWIAICSTTDRRERDGLNLVLDGNFQRAPITVRQNLRFASTAAGPDRPDRVNDEVSR